MYAESIVAERLGLTQEVVGWMPTYHSVADVETFNSRLEEKYSDVYRVAHQESQGTQNPTLAFRTAMHRALDSVLTRDEIRWMENERHLSMCDAAYWMTRYLYVKNEQNIIERFRFRPPQRVYFDVMAALESRRAAIEVIANKARQLGVSVCTEALISHRICFTYGVNAIIASADQVKTNLMAQMLFLAYDMMPWWMPPLDTRRVESAQGMLVFAGMRSGVSFQHGSQISGIARGYTPTVFHLSEVSSYQDASQLIEASLFKCVHASPNVLGILESTAEGDIGWWYDTYWGSKAKWPRGMARLFPLFLPWFLGTSIYPTPTWINTHPIPHNWDMDDATVQMIARAKMYVQSNPILESVLGKDWRLGPEQAWFWEVNYLEHKAKGKEKLWFQEMPTDDHESFQGSYDNVFGRDTINLVYSKRKTAYDCYAIVGQSIEHKFEPATDDIDYDAPRVPVVYRSNRGEEFRWEFIPLLWEEPFEKVEDIGTLGDPHGKLFVWHRPEPGYDYSIGVDTSNGIGKDATCIAVCRRAKSPAEPDVQAAEFRWNEVSHIEAFAFVMAIAGYYSRYMAESLPLQREPYVTIEQIAAVGDTCQLQMHKMGYARFHKMVRYDSKDIKKHKARRLGWYTVGWSRPMLTDGFVIAVQNGWYVVNSPFTVWEMDHWEVHLTQAKKNKYEHAVNATDDGIFANAMATFCPNDMAALAERSKKRIQPSGEILPEVDFRPYDGHRMSVTGQETTERQRRDLEYELWR